MSCQVGIEPDGMGVQMGLGKGLEVEVEVGSEQEGGPDGIETADCSVLAPCQTISLERAKNNIMTMDVSNCFPVQFIQRTRDLNNTFKYIDLKLYFYLSICIKMFFVKRVSTSVPSFASTDLLSSQLGL